MQAVPHVVLHDAPQKLVLGFCMPGATSPVQTHPDFACLSHQGPLQVPLSTADNRSTGKISSSVRLREIKISNTRSSCDSKLPVTAGRTSARQGLPLAKAMSLVWLCILSTMSPRDSPPAPFFILPAFLLQAWWTVLGAWQDSTKNRESNKQN